MILKRNLKVNKCFLSGLFEVYTTFDLLQFRYQLQNLSPIMKFVLQYLGEI